MQNNNLNIAVIGAGGGLGSEFVRQYSENDSVNKVYAFTSSETNFNSPKIITNHIDINDEESIKKSAEIASKDNKLDIVIIAVGMLHDDNISPEKSSRELSKEKFEKIFAINTIAPAIITKYFAPKLNKDNKSVLAAISARVGSISDNYLGGWYSYRASKSALNMILKNFSIEINRSNKNSIILGLHPGTVDTKLSKPFQSAVKKEKLFTANYSVEKMIEVINNKTIKDSGNIFDYQGIKIEF